MKDYDQIYKNIFKCGVMFFFMFLRYIWCLEDYEVMTIIRIRKFVEENINQKKYDFFKLHKKDYNYYKIELLDDGLSLSPFYVCKNKIEDTKKHYLSSLQNNMNKFAERLVKMISQQMDTDLKNLVVIVDDLRINKTYEKMDFCKMIHALLNEKITGNIKVTSPLDATAHEFKYSAENTFRKDAVILKFPVDKYFNHEKYDVYLYNEIQFDSERVLELIKDVKLSYTSSRIRNYIRYSITNEIEKKESLKTIYEIFPVDYDYNKKDNDHIKELEDQIEKGVIKVDGKMFNEYKRFYENLTNHDIKGIIVLFYHISKNKTLLEKIIGVEVQDYSIQELCRFLRCSKDQDFKDKTLNSLDIDSFFASTKIKSLKNITILRSFLVMFYIKCSYHFLFDITDQIKKMSNDFVNFNLFDCEIQDQEVLKIIHKAVDFITISQNNNEKDFEEDIKNYITKYEKCSACDLEKLKKQARIFGIYSLMNEVSDIPEKFEEVYSLNLKEVITE